MACRYPVSLNSFEFNPILRTVHSVLVNTTSVSLWLKLWILLQYISVKRGKDKFVRLLVHILFAIYVLLFLENRVKGIRANTLLASFLFSGSPSLTNPILDHLSFILLVLNATQLTL